MIKQITRGFYRPLMPPEIWQYGFDFGITGVFARIYHGPEFVEKKHFKTVEEAATWLIIKSKENEESYRKELEEWQNKKKQSALKEGE